ncbi:MAG: adenylyl-sulfate kinase, partial [Pirellulales bacterium]
VDARHGVVTQTKRHSFIVSLLGIKHVIVAINKMDLVDWSADVYDQIKSDYTNFAARMSSDDVHFIPMSALLGDNVVKGGENMPWYEGPTLMHLLENVYIASDRNLQDFRYPVQFVNRPNLNFRGYCGTIASGVVRTGDEITVLPSRKTSRIKSIVTYEGELEEAFTPLAVTLTLEDEIDVSRGDMIVRSGNVPKVGKKFDAMIVWMSDQPLVPGKEYLFKQTTKQVTGRISTMRYQVDVNTMHRSDASTLELNEIGRCAIELTEPIAYDAYKQNRGTGSMIIIDRISNATVGAAMILDTAAATEGDLWDSAPASEDIHGERSSVTVDQRARRFGQQPVTIVLTGLTGSHKADVAEALERKLFDEGRAVTVLAGQTMRLGLSKDLGFSSEERSENLRRGAEVARLMNDAGLICIAPFLAPSEEVRQKVRQRVGEDRYLEIYLSAPVAYCRTRESAAEMYAKADSGDIPNFPGVTADYEVPANPDLTLPTDKLSPSEAADRIMELLSKRELI